MADELHPSDDPFADNAAPVETGVAQPVEQDPDQIHYDNTHPAPSPTASWKEKMVRARQEGYSWDDIGAWAQTKRTEAKAAGYTDQEVNSYFGLTEADWTELDKKTAARVEGARPEKGWNPKDAKTWKETFEAGFGLSASALPFGAPEYALPENAGTVQRLLAGLGTVVGDIPVSVAGAAALFAPGAAAGGAAGTAIAPGPGTATGAGVGGLLASGYGSMALPEYVRGMYLEYYQKGQVKTPTEFLDRMLQSAWEANKQGLVGAATAGAGKAARVAQPLASATKRELTAAGAELATMVSGQSIVAGQLPTRESILDATLLMMTMRGGIAGSKLYFKSYEAVESRLMQHWAKTGEPLDQIIRRAEREPEFRETFFAKIPERGKNEHDVFHGTAAAFEKFDPTKQGEVTGAKDAQMATYFTDRPEVADYYARFAVAQASDAPIAEISGPNIRPSRLTLDNPMVVDMKGDNYSQTKSVGSLVRAKQLGYDGVIFENVNDGGGTTGRVFAAFDAPNQAKSRFELASIPENQLVEDSTRPFVLNTEQPGPAKTAQLKALVGSGGGQPPIPPPPPPSGPLSPLDAARASVRGRIGEIKDPKMTFKDLTDRAYYEMIDDKHPLLQMTKAIADGDKTALEAAGHVENLFRLSEGSQGAAEGAIQYGVREYATGKKISKGLDEIIGQLKSKERAEFKEYLVARRDVELSKKGLDLAGKDIAQSHIVRDAFEAKYKDRADDLVRYNNATLAELRDSNLISKESFKIWAATDYTVPFYRLFDDAFKSKGAGRGEGAFNPIKELVGSTKKIADPYEGLIKNTYTRMELAARSRQTNALIDFSMKFQKAGMDFVVKSRELTRPIKLSPEEMQKFADLVGGDASLAENDFVLYRHFQKQLGPNEVLDYRNGKATAYELPPDVARFMKGMDRDSQSLLDKVMTGFAGALRKGVTLSPDFPIRQLFKDEPWAFITGKKEAPPYVDFVTGVGHFMGRSDMYQKWLSAGGGNSAVTSFADTYLRSGILTKYKETDFLGGVRNVLASPWHALHALGDLQANASRIGAFARLEKKIGTEEAAQYSRQRTLDFKRLGTVTRTLNRMIPFLGPTLNGLDRSVRSLNDPATYVKAAAIVTVPVLLNWWANKDEEWYKELPEWQKDLTIPFKAGDTIYRIPLPPFFGALFGGLPRRLMEQFANDNPEAFKDFADTLLLDLTPAAQFSAFLPIVEHITNYNFFTNAPIIPAKVENTLAPEQYTDYSTKTAKGIARFLSDVPIIKDFNLSAPIIENYVRNWGGTLGMQALTLSDNALVAGGIIDDPVKPEVSLADLPFIKSFVVRYPSARAQSIQDFYQNYDAHQKLMGSLKVVQTQLGQGLPGAADRLTELLTTHQRDLLTIDGTAKALAAQRKLISNTINSRAFTPHDKRQIIDQAYATMIVEAQLANQLIAAVDTAAKK